MMITATGNNGNDKKVIFPALPAAKIQGSGFRFECSGFRSAVRLSWINNLKVTTSILLCSTSLLFAFNRKRLSTGFIPGIIRFYRANYNRITTELQPNKKRFTCGCLILKKLYRLVDNTA